MTALNVLSSVLFMFGLLIVHLQMMVNPDDPTDVHTVAHEYRDTWTFGWTIVYCYIVLSMCLAALMDPSRLGQLAIRAVKGWSVELAAWRVMLLGLVMPVIGIGFAIYANVCCEGDWILQ